MSYFILDETLSFPPVEHADEAGLLAVGGDLSPQRLLLAYRSGIFPWYDKDEPILWWSPHPRFVLFPHELKVSKSTEKIIRKEIFEVSLDLAFPEVIHNCQLIKRKGQQGTWINDDMLMAYLELHKMGYAHSVEVWEKGILVGGLYGVSLGRIFFGESMFSKVNNASKVGFVIFVRDFLTKHGFQVIDCQIYTKYLADLGAKMIPRSDFIQSLKDALKKDTLREPWNNYFK